MSSKEILEGNELIAEWMAVNSNHKWMLLNLYKAKMRWDWIMDVVEKIEGLGYWVTMMPWQCQIFKANGNFCEEMIIDSDFCETRLENTYKGIVEFIKWYTTQTPQ